MLEQGSVPVELLESPTDHSVEKEEMLLSSLGSIVENQIVEFKLLFHLLLQFQKL